MLRHEQVHFDIAQLYACRLKLAFNNYHYSSNFSEEIQEIFNQKKAEYHSLQKRYDAETNHSLIITKQKEWEAFIKDELAKVMVQQNLIP